VQLLVQRPHHDLVRRHKGRRQLAPAVQLQQVLAQQGAAHHDRQQRRADLRVGAEPSISRTD
jgi:hypothetical protein